MLKTSDFDYPLPLELIAQTPVYPRDTSRLLVSHKKDSQLILRDSVFTELPHILRNQFGDLPILCITNDTFVVNARIPCLRKNTYPSEVFLLSFERPYLSCLLKPQAKIKEGEILTAKNGVPLFKVISKDPCLVEPLEDLDVILKEYGTLPLPPYIKDTPDDLSRYQTIYSQKESQSVAAPTAGLHFTPEVMDHCKSKNIEFCSLQLCIGLGTFQPVVADQIKDHKMHEEWYRVPTDSWDKIQSYASKGHPIIYVGTTAFRALESFARDNKEAGKFHLTSLYITPQKDPFKPCYGQGMITNFHSPKSTLVMLIASLMGFDDWRKTYDHAIFQKYRFLSFGDSNVLFF